MTKYNWVEINGKEVHEGQTCTIDHAVQTIEVQIRAINGVPLDVLKRLIQEKFEVVSIELTGATVYVDAGLPDFIGE